MKSIRIFNKSLYFWIRELHLYLGLFISPFILVFAISTILFNHTFKPWNKTKVEKTTARVEVPEGIKGGLEGAEKAKEIIRQINVSGEVGPVRYRPKENQLFIPVFKPGQRVIISINLETQIAEIERRHTDIWQTLFYLHRSPGPHKVNFPHNWVFTRIWGGLADTVVCLILFVSASGIYMWALIKAERKIGLILLGAGALSFVLIVSALVA